MDKQETNAHEPEWQALMRDMQEMSNQLREEMEALPPFPPINCIEFELAYRYEFVIAGYAKEALEFSWEGYILTLKALNAVELSAQEHFVVQEYPMLPFERYIALPENTEPELMQAKFENGILNVLLPKKARLL